jgi:hypothetical protein
METGIKIIIGYVKLCSQFSHLLVVSATIFLMTLVQAQFATFHWIRFARTVLHAVFTNDKVLLD